MKKFVLKKVFDIRPLTKSGELNLRWILRQGKIVRTPKTTSRIKEVISQSQSKAGSPLTKKEKKSSINLPAWESQRSGFLRYEHEDIRDTLMRELEDLDLKENKLKQDFGPPLNLPIEQELKREKRAKLILKKLFPQKINLRAKLPSFDFSLAPSFKYVVVSLVVLALLFPSIYILSNISSTKNTVLTSGKDGYENLLAAQEALLSFNPQAAAQNFKEAYGSFSKASGAVNSLGGSLLEVVDVLPLKYKVGPGRKLLEAGQLISKAGEELAKGLEGLSSLELHNLIGGDAEFAIAENTPTYALKQFRESFALASGDLKKGIENLKLIEADDLPKEYRNKFASLGSVLPGLEKALDSFDGYFQLFLSMLADENPRHYLILFQNNSELRATGGFIGSYALIRVHQGRIDEIEVKNIFDADGQLIVNVIPPKPIQKISSGWSTHDANWFLDFPTSAEKVAWFFEKTGGPTVDGVIAITPEVVENLLGIFGSVDLPEHELKVTKDNFIEEVQYKVEEDYDPYLNEPKKILSDFTTSLIAKLANADKSVWTKIASNFKESLTQKNILLWLKNDKEQEVIVNQGWSGEIQETEGDYLAIVHSNINGYKTDRYMDEDINLNILFDRDGKPFHQLTIKRKHTGGNEQYEWYNKVNSNYMRVYLPKGTQVIEASGNSSEFIAPPLDYESLRFRADETILSIEASLVKEPNSGVDIFEESGKTVIGAWIYTSPGEESVFKLTYQVPESVINHNNIEKLPNEETESLSYGLVLQRQPGTDESTLRVAIAYPLTWRVKQVYPRTSLISQSPVRFRETIDTDKVFGVNFKIFK